MIARHALLCLSLVWTGLAEQLAPRQPAIHRTAPNGHQHRSWVKRANHSTSDPPADSSNPLGGPILGYPLVDLGYARHVAQITNTPDSRQILNFSNIRYAAPPVDSLRFQLPEDPVNNRSAGVQNGTYGKICPQAYAPWQNSAFVTSPPGEVESEDCLFLDVLVPAEVWLRRAFVPRPVIVWFHGGGYQIGAKWGTPASNPLGLIDRSFEDGPFDDDGEGVIWIGVQYRVRHMSWPSHVDVRTDVECSSVPLAFSKAAHFGRVVESQILVSTTSARLWNGCSYGPSISVAT